jgi:type I restriction enzyme S subunit
MKADLPSYELAESSVTFRDTPIPNHWTMSRLRFLMRSKLSNGLFKKAEFWGEGSPIVNVGDAYVHDNAVDLEKLDRVQCSEAELRTYRVDHGDILFVRSSLKLEGIGKPAIVLNPTEPTVFECHLVNGKPDSRKIDPEFFIRFLNAVESRSFLVACAKTATMSTIEQGRIKDLEILCPPLLEQRKIVSFLDRETAKIDRLMEVRRKQVERLQEQRTAVIHHAVTKGLDPHAKMKSSGIEWLGDVPEGWAVKRLKYVAACNQWILGENTSADYVLDYIDIGNVSSTDGIWETQTFEFKDAPSRARRQLRDGSTIISTVRTYLKAIAFIEQPPDNLIASTGFAVLDPSKELRGRFLYHAVASEYFIQRVIAESKGVGYPAINASDLVNIFIAFPKSLAEQDTVLEYIERETAKHDTLISKYRRELELLGEYRASLISHAVTGKIDVRGLVALVQHEGAAPL